MGIFNRKKNAAIATGYKIITDQGEGFYSWNGNLYKSDVVRAAIRPKARAIGKTIGKHIRETVNEDGTKTLQVNPEPYIRFLLEEPNPYMTGQMLQEKLAVQLELNNNAFAYIMRDENGYPMEIYPITTSSCKAFYDKQNELYIQFVIKNRRTVNIRYTNIIHLRKDYNAHEIFGDSPAEALTELMEIVTTTDQGIVKAIKNSNIIKWLLKFNSNLKEKDLKKNVKAFNDMFLSIDSETGGAAGTDGKFDAQQIEPKDYVPNALLTDRTIKRIYSFFNTNEKIVQGTYSENEWISYYEGSVEPDVMQLSNEYKRKIFSRRQRGCGNKIIFEAANLTFASMSTKLGLAKFVELGIFNPNEVREILNYAPREGGDEYVRRLDTRPTSEDGKEDDD